MVDRSFTKRKADEIEYYMWNVVEAEMSQNDTVTLGDFSASTAILIDTLVRKDTGVELTSSIANNVITMTSAGTNLKVIIFAFGVKA
jgi:hypothetical protein